MMKDEIVEQVRKVREENAAKFNKFNYDLKAIMADARKRQKDSGASGGVVRSEAKEEELVSAWVAPRY